MTLTELRDALAELEADIIRSLGRLRRVLVDAQTLRVNTTAHQRWLPWK